MRMAAAALEQQRVSFFRVLAQCRDKRGLIIERIRMLHALFLRSGYHGRCIRTVGVQGVRVLRRRTTGTAMTFLGVIAKLEHRAENRKPAAVPGHAARARTA